MLRRHFLLLPLVLLVGLIAFEAGRRVGASKEAPARGASASALASASTPATACDKELAQAKLMLGICLAFHPGTTPSSGTNPPAEATGNPLDSLFLRQGSTPAVRLDKPLTTEMIAPTDKVVVRRPDGTVRIYAPGQWPPPGGPGVGSTVLGRWRADGTAEISPPDSRPAPDSPASMPGELELERLGRLIRETPGAILVRHADGSLHVYRPDQWPPPGGPDGGTVLGHRRGDGGFVPIWPDDDEED